MALLLTRARLSSLPGVALPRVALLHSLRATVVAALVLGIVGSGSPHVAATLVSAALLLIAGIIVVVAATRLLAGEVAVRVLLSLSPVIARSKFHGAKVLALTLRRTVVLALRHALRIVRLAATLA